MDSLGESEVMNIKRISASGEINEVEDILATEEPMEIQLEFGSGNQRQNKNISVTMRTPGHDDELAVGFLYTEGVISNTTDLTSIEHVDSDKNRIRVFLKEGVEPTLGSVERNFYTTSSCGVCGKASIEAVHVQRFERKVLWTTTKVSREVLFRLQDELMERQETFKSTGGLHASSLFDQDGTFIILREDVGRHNALDKVIGAILLKEKNFPWQEKILLLSGRASFELIQKAVMAGIRIVVAVGAPSSLAVSLARDMGITLVGFLKRDRFNIYTRAERIL